MASRLEVNGGQPIRLVLVEDTKTTMNLLLEVFSNTTDIEVVATFEDGEQTIAAIERYAPHIVLMDINMPNMNGYQTSAWIMEHCPLPIILMTATWDINEVRPIVESMEIGVVEVMKKPPGPFDPDFENQIKHLLETIRAMVDVKVVRRRKIEVRQPFNLLQTNRVFNKVLVGASTGGPPALHSLLHLLPINFSMPIVIAQHMSGEFIESFVDWLNTVCDLYVKQAQHGEPLLPGIVYVPPMGFHIALENNTVRLEPAAKDAFIVPEVDYLFKSVSPEDAKNTIAILLTGMGNDGSEGMSYLHRNGALTFAQDESSCVVYSMPKEAVNLKAVDYLLSPSQMSTQLLELSFLQGNH